MAPGLLARLRHYAADTPQRPALTFLEEDGSAHTLCFGEVERASLRLAARLAAAAPAARRALLLHRPGPAFVVALCACWAAGITPVPTYPPTRRAGSRASERFARLAADADPQLVLVDGASLARVREAAGTLPASLPWLATDTDAGADAPAAAPGPASEPALIQYTSGSTGTPRGVCLSHANLEANLDTIGRRFGLDSDACVVSWLPPYHDMGLIGGILPMLAFGAHLVLMAPATFIGRPRRWLDAVSRYRASHSGGPNFAFDLCAQKLAPADLDGLDLSCWRVAFCGAETVHAASLARFSALAAPAGFRADALMPCYGLAEATLLVAAREPGAGVATHALAVGGAPARERVSCGTAAPGVGLAVADEHGRPCPERTVGEILVSGAAVANGYWGGGDPARVFGQPLAGSAAAWLRTGDCGYLHEGQLYVTGRSKDIIILRGRNCYPADAEQAAGSAHPALDPLGLAAFGADGGGGERLVLACELRREHRRADPAQVRRAIQSALGEALEIRADDIVLLPPGALPRTTSGKISRSAARAAWEAGEWDGTASADDGNTGAYPALLACAARLAGIAPGRLDAGWTLDELGIDSLRRVELALLLEQELGRRVTVDQLLPDLPLSQLRGLIEDRPATPQPDSAGTAFPPSPAQLDLLQAGVDDVNDFIEIVYLRMPARPDLSALDRALGWLAQRHPALRLRFARGGALGWEARLSGAGIALSRLDMAEASAHAQGWRAALVGALRAAIDIERGAVAHAAWLDRGGEETGVLALAVHHAVCDAVSLAILVHGLRHAYSHAGQLPPARPDTYLAWLAAGPARAADHAWAAREHAFWRAVGGSAPRPAAQPLPVQLGSVPPHHLSTAASQQLRARFRGGRARHDLLLAAFCHAWCAVTGSASALVMLTGHGRTGMAADAVGWIASSYPVRVPATRPEEQYEAARAAHAAVAAHADAYPLLRFADLEPLARPALAFEYRSGIDQRYRDGAAFTFLGYEQHADAWREACARNGHLPAMALAAGMVDGALAWSLCYLPEPGGAERAQQVQEAMAAFLARLAG